MPGGPQTARHCSIINDFSTEYAQSEAARIPDRQRLLVLCFANKADPKTLNRATGIVLVVLGVVIMGFNLLS